MKCTCRGATPNPECNRDHASETERAYALRFDLSLLPKFVAEALQCIDADEMAKWYTKLAYISFAEDAAAVFGEAAGKLISNAVREYMDHCVEHEMKTNSPTRSAFLQGALEGEIGALTRIIERYQ